MSEGATVSKLSEFIAEERKRLETNDGNRFAFSLGQADRYFHFLEIVRDRGGEVGNQWRKNFMLHIAPHMRAGGNAPVTEEENLASKESLRMAELIHLETETFFMFAKVFLDKLAHSFEYCFGSVRGVSCESHGRLLKGLAKYVEGAKLIVPKTFESRMRSADSGICDVRDKLIAHLKDSRIIRSTQWGPDGSVEMGFGLLYPKDNEQLPLAASVPAAFAQIDAFLDDVLVVFRTNRSRMRFKLEGMSATGAR
jgi:hypothetical protein